jgi:hypothetical protein
MVVVVVVETGTVVVVVAGARVVTGVSVVDDGSIAAWEAVHADATSRIAEAPRMLLRCMAAR